MATPRYQRIGIWIIASVLTIGTIGSFFAVILTNQNQANDQAKIQKIYQEYTEKVKSQNDELSEKYYDEFNKYSELPAKFNANDVKDLTKKDLKVGSGDEVKPGTEYSAYYIGWNPKGVIFDQSIENAKLKPPISGGGLIQGWEDGVIGMKFGGIRELTIPSEKAYGEAGSGENIPPNTPIKFIVMIIPKVEVIPMPDELLQQYY